MCLWMTFVKLNFILNGADFKVVKRKTQTSALACPGLINLKGEPKFPTTDFVYAVII